MNIDFLLEQLRSRTRNLHKRSAPAAKRAGRLHRKFRRSQFQNLESRRLLSADVSLSGSTLSIHDWSGINDEFEIKIENHSIKVSNINELVAHGFSDADPNDNGVELPADGITTILVTAAAGNDSITVGELNDVSIGLYGGDGNDIYHINDGWHHAHIVDSNGGELDLSNVSGELTASLSAGDVIVENSSGDQIQFAKTAGIRLADSLLHQDANETELNAGLSEISALGDDLSTFDAMDRELPLFNGQKLGAVLPIGDILESTLTDPVNDYLTGSNSDVLGLIAAIEDVDVSNYSGPGNLSVNTVANVSFVDDSLKVSLSMQVTLTHADEPLSLDQQILSLDDQLETNLTTPDLRADLVTSFDWDFSFGIDATGTTFFFADFGSDLDVQAQVNMDDADFRIVAGLLGLDVGPNGPGDSNSFISLDASTTLDTSALNNLAGGDSVLSLTELQVSSRLNGFSQDTAASALVDIALYPLATDVSGVTDSDITEITFSQDGWGNADAAFSQNLTDRPIDAFFNMGRDSVLQVMQQIGTYLDTLSLKAIDSERILLGEAKTFGDLVDVAGLYQDEFLRRMELPPFIATTPLGDIVEVEDLQTLADALGTSGGGEAEMTITLRDSSKSFDVNVGSPSTLGGVASAISAAAMFAGVTTDQFEIITAEDGLIQLVDKTAESVDGNTFTITPKQDPSGDDYAVAANLGLTAAAKEQDIVVGGDPEHVIVLAPNIGANFLTLQEMLSLPTDNSDGAPLTSIGAMTFDAATSKFAFTIDLAKTYDSQIDEIQIPEFGSLVSVDASGTLKLDDPTLSLHLPIEIDLSEIGFADGFSAATPLADLNDSKGVPIADGLDDIRIHLADGTSFPVNLDQSLSDIPLASIHDGAGLTTNGLGVADLTITLNDGNSFTVDLDANIQSSGAAPTNLGEIVEAIQAAADQDSELTGTVSSGSTSSSIVDSSSPFGADDSLVGRSLTIGSETQQILSNTADTLTLAGSFQTVPGTGETLTVESSRNGFARLDTRRGTLTLTDITSPAGAPTFAVTGDGTAQDASVALGLAGTAEYQNTTGTELYVIEDSLVTVNEYISAIKSAASSAGLNLPSPRATADPGAYNEDWDFDVQIAGDGIVLVDRTEEVAALTGTAVAIDIPAGETSDELKIAGTFPGVADDELIGRVVTITAGTGVGESLMITGNTSNKLTLEAAWSTPPDATSQYEIPNGLIVAALNDSGARIGLGLGTDAKGQATHPDTILFQGLQGLGIRTNGSSAADLTITLSGAAGSFSVDLDTNPDTGQLESPGTIADVVERISRAAVAGGYSSTQFEVFYHEGKQAYFLIDRGQAGDVTSFTAANAGAFSLAATDLGLSTGSSENVDFTTPEGDELDPEFVMELKSPTRLLGGSPLHGDTAAGHFQLIQSATPTISVTVDTDATGGTGTALFGATSVEISDLTIDKASSHTAAALTLETASVSQLWNGLSDPFTWLLGGEVEFSQPLDLSMKLRPEPAITGVDAATKTDFIVDVVNLYDVRSGSETVIPSLPGNDVAQAMLVATEHVTVADMYDYLDSVADYLLTLQNQSQLADNLPGLAASLSELFPFGDHFRTHLEALKELPAELQPRSIQELASQLSSRLEGGELNVVLSFSEVDQQLSFEIQLDLDAIQANVPMAFNLPNLGLNRDALGLQKVAAINDSLRQSPATVVADGSVDVGLAIDLSDPDNPAPLLIGTAGIGNGTEAAFEVAASNVDAFSFTTLFGSVPTEVLTGYFVLDLDGDGNSTSSATFHADLTSDASISDPSEVETAASASETPVSLTGKMNADFQLAFPEQIVPNDAPQTRPSIQLTIGDIDSPTDSSTLTTNMIGGVGNWPTFETLTQNFSLANSMDGFRLGFYELFTHLDNALDTSLLGRELPLVGKQLGDTADFLLQIRDSVVDNLEFYGAETSIESVRQGLFDAFGPGGYNWLQNLPASGDSSVNIDDVQVRTDTIEVDGNTLVVGVEFELDLEMATQSLQTPVDLDLLLPGLGLETDALADVNFGFHFPMKVGVSIADGVYLDVASTSDLEIQLDVGLPAHAVTMSADPRLTFANTTSTAPSIQRDRGNWILDGFQVGQIISVANSASNDGSYLIADITDNGLTLEIKPTNASLERTNNSNDRVVQEGPTSGISVTVTEITATGMPALTFHNETRSSTNAFGFVSTIDVYDSITRDTGNWRTDGFNEGDLIVVSGSGSNDGTYRVFEISESGRVLTVEPTQSPGATLVQETTSDATVKRSQSTTMSGRLGVLPVRIWDATPGQSKLTGTFVIDLHDPQVVGENHRLAVNDLTAESPFPIEPIRGFTNSPLPNLLSITESATDPLQLNPLSLTIETDLPKSAAFAPYRLTLDVSNWDWTVSDSLVVQTQVPTIEFNDVQFDLVGFTRDFMGPAITRLSESLDAADAILKFLESEAMPILSLIFGRKSYSQTPAAFGGTTEQGNFVGAVVAIRALARGGSPFERDFITETGSDLFGSGEFDNIVLKPIALLTGQEWIDLGNFTVNGTVARGGSGQLFNSEENQERALGSFNDSPESGTILGQITAVARDDSSDAQHAALSFITTQMLPGVTRLGFLGDILPPVAQRAIRTVQDGSIQPIGLPILSHSFDLLLGQTSLDGNAEQDSFLLTYQTPELSYLLYKMIPLEWQSTLSTLIHPLVGTLVGRPLDNAKYVFPFVSVAFEARAKYAMAFDTTGLQRFRYTGNPDDILNGFFFDDFNGINPAPSAVGNLNVGAGSQSGASTGFGAASTRSDEPQIRILGGIGAGVFIDPFRNLAGGKLREFIKAQVGFELSFFVGQDLNFNDPDGDGRVRAFEFDGLTDFSVDTLTGQNTADGKDAFDDGIRLEVRADVFANIVVGIFLTQRPPIFGLKISFNIFTARINLVTIGFTIPISSESYSPADLGTPVGGWPTFLGLPNRSQPINGTLDLVLSSTADNQVYIGATSAPDDQNRQNIVVSSGGIFQYFTAVDAISGTAGSGNDSIYVMLNVFVPVTIHGGAGDDVIIGGSGDDHLVGGAGNDYVSGQVGNDTLYGDDEARTLSGLDILLGGIGNDVIFGGGGRDVIRGWRDDDQIHGDGGNDLIDGGTGVDTIDGDAGSDHLLGGLGRDVMRGGDDDDRIEGGYDADSIEGGSGDDLIWGGFGNDTIQGDDGQDGLYGEQHNDTIDGGLGDDTVDGGLASDRLSGGEGDDKILSLDGNDVLNGNRGDDTFYVYYVDGKANSLIKVLDSGPSEDTDVFIAVGTLSPDQFLLRASISGSNAFVALLNDPDHAPTEAGYDPAVQRVNYSGVERIVVQGGLGNDHFAVDDSAAEITINGEGGDDSFQIGQLFRSERNEEDANVSVDDVFATIETTRGFLSNGISSPMTINGGLGNDRFVVFHNKAVLSLNGDAGDDQFEVRAFALVGSREPERQRTDITGGAGADLVQYAVNAPVSINGGDGFDVLTVIGTEFGDDFVVTENGVFGAGLTINFTRIESLRIDGAEGNDRFYVKSTSETFLTELFGGLGEDTFNLSGDTPPVVSNDLKGHSGIVTHGVTHSTDVRYEDMKVEGISANVADNDEPFVVILPSGGSSIVSETSSSDTSLFDYYDVVLTRAPLVGFDVLVKALAPLPSPDRRNLGALAFRLSSRAIGADEKQDGSAVTLRFTADNWQIPQRVEIRADSVTQYDTGGVFTRSDLLPAIDPTTVAEFTYNDDALEGEQSASINHLVTSTAASVQGTPIGVVAQATLNIATNRPFYEFTGKTIEVTLADGVTVQTRRIDSARLVDGNMQLTVDRAWLHGAGVPDSTSTVEITLDGEVLTTNPLFAANPIFTVPEPLDAFNPFLDSVDDLLGRQVSIVDGAGTGQSRFITGADAIVGLSGRDTDVFSPQSSTFQFDLTEGVERVSVTSGATLRVHAVGDFDSSYENLDVTINGTYVTTLYDGNLGRLYQSTTAVVELTQTQMQDFLIDGELSIEFKPSSSVNDFGDAYPTSSIEMELEFTVDAADTSFQKDILGDLKLTLDRGWQPSDVPDSNSTYQIRVDDSLIGKMTGVDVSPTGLPDDERFPDELDTRTTFSDTEATFDDSQFGPEGLRGATLEIVGGPGAGQLRLVLGTLDTHTLILNGGWNTEPVPGESLYRIRRYDGLAVVSVAVAINDNDEAGVIVDQTHGLDTSATTPVMIDGNTITAVIEGGDGDHRGEQDLVRVKLSRNPTDSVNVTLVLDGVQLSVAQIDGTPIAGGTLTFDASNWDDYQDVRIVALHDSIREGFHTSQIQFVTTSTNVDVTRDQTDQFKISPSAPVSLVGMSRQAVAINTVTYNQQSLLAYDAITNPGTPSMPAWQWVGNQLVFLADGKPTSVVGNTLKIDYDYLDIGFNDVFRQPVLVRISDADAPSVLIRELGGSTDVIEGSAEFTRIEYSGDAGLAIALTSRTIEVVAGTGIGQTAVILDSESNSLTLDRLWDTVPDETTQFTISNDVVGGSSSLGTVEGTMPGPYSRQSHVFSLVAGVAYTFSLEGSANGGTANPDPYLWVHDPLGRLVAHNDDGGAGLNSWIEFVPSISGPHTLLAGGYSSRFGSYTLTAKFRDDIPDSTSTSAKVFAPGSASSEIDSGTDQDWFAVQMAVGNTYTFDLEGSSTSQGTLANPKLRLLDADGTEIESDEDSGTGNNSQITFIPTETGTYYLSAEGVSGSMGTYRFTTAVEPLVLDVVRADIQSLQTDSYEVVLTAQPERGSAGTGEVEVTITPEITKTTRTGGIRTDAQQVEIYSLDGLPVERVRVDGENLIITFDEDNWDEPIRIGVRAIDDDKVDGGDTKQFANGANTVSRILGPVVVDGAGGEGSLEGLGNPEKLPVETNVKPKTGDVDSVAGNVITLQTLTSLQLSSLGLEDDLSDVTELINKTLEVVAIHPSADWRAAYPDATTGNPADPVVGKFRLITDVTVVAGKIVVTLNDDFGVADDVIKSYALTSESLNFFVDETQSVDYLFLHDEDSPADSSGFLTANRIGGLNMGPDISIGGRLQSGGVSYGNLEVLQIDLGVGNNDFQVLGTHTRRDDPNTSMDETYQTWTFLNTGDDILWPLTGLMGDVVHVALDAEDVTVATGTATSATNANNTRFTELVDSTASFGADDSLKGYQLTTVNALGTKQTKTILGNTNTSVSVDGIWVELPVLGDSYEIVNPQDGAFAVNTQGGNDTVDASASTLGIVAFGGLGRDTLTGGAGDDILLGDQGRVDYYGNDDGAGNHPVVTRLGTVIDPIMGSVTGDFTDSGNLLDAGANFPLPSDTDTGLRGLYVDINNGTGFLQKPRLITDNTATTLTVWPEFSETLDGTSEYRISTMPENQTDGFVRGANLILTIDNEAGDDDEIHGGAGSDQILGGVGEDTIHGDTGNDIILGDGGVIDRAAIVSDPTARTVNSVLDLVRTKSYEFGGNDYITAGEGQKTIFGGAGDDQLLAGGDSEADIIIGDEGVADFDPVTGIRITIETAHPDEGGADVITAGNASNMLFGGAAGDQINGGDERDVILGDNGRATFDEAGELTFIESTDTGIGGIDIILSGGGNDVVLGGAMGDTIYGGAGLDTLFGDSGRIDYTLDGDPTTLDQIITIDPTIGGEDSIWGEAGNDILIGGALGDTLSGGDDHDILLGDHGEVDFRRPVDKRVVSRYITVADGGGNDTIDGDAGDDFVFGGQGDDIISGGAGQDDLVGGHNVPFGADGNDTISGDDDEDVVLGDNGIITRTLLSTELGTWENYLAPFDAIVIREVQPFDDRDLIAGDDILFGGAAMDIIRGQRGDDAIHGGDADDELIGGLGSDTIFGDAGNDFMLADAGNILRDFNEDGAPQLNQDGTWHRDLITERIAHVIDIIPTGPSGLIDIPADLADRLLDADQILLASMHLPSGFGIPDSGGFTQTVAILLDLVDADDDILDGGTGNDIALGQRGNDTLSGGEGDDTLIGDHGINVAPMETDLPQMVDAWRLIGVEAGYDDLSGIQLDLPGFGKVIVPELVAEPGELVAERPRWDRVTGVNATLSEIANQDLLVTDDDLRLSASIVLTPGFVGHTDSLQGNDTLNGNEGNDFLIGDNWIVTSDLQTGVTPIHEAIDNATGAVAGLMHAFEALALDRDVVRYEIDGSPTPTREVVIGKDTLTGGTGSDTIIGDTGTFELPFTREIPGESTITENAIEFQQYLSLLQAVADDATGLLSRVHLGVVDQLLSDAAAARPSLPAISGDDIEFVQYHELNIGGDTIDGGEDNDTLLGGDATLIAPIVTGNLSDFPVSYGVSGLNADELEALELELYEQARIEGQSLDARRESRVVRVEQELSRRTPLDRIAYVPSLDRILDNDTITGGTGNDLVTGDFSILATPLVQTTPTTSVEVDDLDAYVEMLLDEIADGDRPYVASSYDRSIGRETLASSVTDAMSPASRHQTIGGIWSIGEDSIQSEEGNDIVMGDHVAIVSPVMVNNPEQYVSLRRADYSTAFLDLSMRALLKDSTLDEVDVQLRGDVIDGGIDDDILMGSVGDDEIEGGAGDDIVLGGNGADILDGGSGDDNVRRDGGDYANLDVHEAMGEAVFDARTPMTTQLLLDAAAGAGTPQVWPGDATNSGTDAGNGAPDSPDTPTERTVTFIAPEQLVAGQPVQIVSGQSVIFGAEVDLLPAEATVLFLWEVTDSDGVVIAVGTGAQFEVTVASVGAYTVQVTTRDSDNGLGTLTSSLEVVDRRLIPDPDHPGQSILIVGGTDQDDHFRLFDVRNEPNSVEIRQQISRGTWSRINYENISRIEVHGGEGDDEVNADRQLLIPLRLYGGAGNDDLRGGAASDYIDGGTGDDRLNGQLGNDILIGGWGEDRMNGGDGDDLLIGEAFTPQDDLTDADSLLARWSHSSDSPADRMLDLIGDLSAAIRGDGSTDTLDGDDGVDWYFSQATDNLRKDRRETDLVTLF
ncbi:Ca2+-binding protein, RTX toxin-related [Neorhodopirellula lusitana]|uniref:Ca2+-binding protein, RTX toxin-related n=1 Tax=Neorhodopirellula lusitana TaxID=445327 RepID=A0ABY1QAV5_9BACT|nr:pre-peptidase C-terminal domain-containing protein [Neorhodopirellula lusitana]SMP65938.1 Ca2+-binding protein, RTX toxin-related [Neorhodopirellula lusitana]